MFEYLIGELSKVYDIPGIEMLGSISFRSAAAIILALMIGTVFGRKVIDILRRKQIGEGVRDLGLQGQLEKKGTPTMGGVIILIAILVPVLLVCNLSNIYIQLMLITTVWLGIIGFVDDYIKVIKKNKDGLSGRYKIIGQVGLGLIIGIAMWQSDKVEVREVELLDRTVVSDSAYSNKVASKTLTTIPFMKNNEFDYNSLNLLSSNEDGDDMCGWIIYVIAAVFIITAVSNGANLTDGLDGLSAGTSAIIAAVLAILAYISGNVIYADYLNIMYLPGTGELFIFGAAFVGALIGFLWYNSYPAQVFMGDTGSLAIGGLIAVFALLIRKELLLPILCGIFLVEALSVIIQVGYFKRTKKKYGEGRRIFLMAPLHHHFQKKGFFEVKIVTRFLIVQLLLAAITLATFKVR